MTKQQKYIAALTTAAKKAPDKIKLKAKIKAVKQAQSWNNYLAQ